MKTIFNQQKALLKIRFTRLFQKKTFCEDSFFFFFFFGVVFLCLVVLEKICQKKTTEDSIKNINYF